MKKLKIAITGGGTGGHLMVAKSLASELGARSVECLFIGSTKGQDREWFANSPLFEKSYFLESSGVMDKKGLGKVFSLLSIIKLSFSAFRILKKERVDGVISVGGYSAAPASFAAKFAKAKLFVHEQNFVVGRLNKLLKNISDGFYSSYGKATFNYPVQESFFKIARVRTKLKNIIFLGGSQGASFINSLALQLAPNLTNMGISITHQCGKAQYEEISNEYKKLGIKVNLFAFSKNIKDELQKADIAISRAGASTVWELCAALLPTIFIPYPSAANNHQYFNAKFLKEQGLGEVIEQQDVTKELILKIIKELPLEKMSSGLKGSINLGGAKEIVDDILNKIER